MTVLMLVRHGNTFGPNDKVVWAGARTDLPLTQTGRQQAEHLGKFWEPTLFRPDRIMAGPLLRTRQHAAIIAGLINHPPQDIEISDALREIDYGTWEALSTEEIYALGGQAELAAWDAHADWPQSPDWSPARAVIDEKIGNLLNRLANDTSTNRAILVTSNGILRFFAGFLTNPPLPGELKVRTGHYCQLVYKSGRWSQFGWDIPPD